MSLIKFSDSLFIHVSSKVSFTQQFSVSAISPCSSTFALFEFDSSFFSEHEFPSTPFEAKMLAKPLANILKLNMDALEAQITIEKDRICFRIQLKNGITKEHLMHYEETPNVRAVYNTNQCTNSCIFNPKVLLDVFSNLASQLATISLVFEPGSFKLQTVSESIELQTQGEVQRSLDTVVTVDVEDFETFSVQTSTVITMNAKELKKILGFGDQFNCSVILSFTGPGSPCIFRYTMNSFVVADFVLATFEADQTQHPVSTQVPTQTNSRVHSMGSGSKRISEPLPKESFVIQPNKTLFQELSILSSKGDTADDEDEDTEVVLPTQFQKRPRIDYEF